MCLFLVVTVKVEQPESVLVRKSTLRLCHLFNNNNNYKYLRIMYHYNIYGCQHGLTLTGRCIKSNIQLLTRRYVHII